MEGRYRAGYSVFCIRGHIVETGFALAKRNAIDRKYVEVSDIICSEMWKEVLSQMSRNA
jgi:hypothetical protein